MSEDEESDQDIFAFDDEEIVIPPTTLIPNDKLSSEMEKIPLDQLNIGSDDQRINIKDFVSSEVEKKRVGLEDFIIKSVIGKGAYGQVFLVQKSETNSLYAMKVLRKASIVVHGIDTEHTKNERSILEAISHPFIVKLYYAFQCPSRLYLILSYCSGGELFNYLSQERMFTEDTTRFYIAELLLALEHLHSLGIIYRDLKPENVMLDAQGHLMLTDFGLSKVAIDALTVCGTVEFMAPEILEERSKYDKSVDYWSLGIMIYDMITGAPPFTGSNRKKIMEAVLKKKPFFPKYMTSASRDICTKLLKKTPHVRLGSGAAGIQEIKSHAFFKKTNWEKTLQRLEKPPYTPAFSDPCDISNFHSEFTSIPIGQTFLQEPPMLAENHQFLGFSFVANTFDE